MHSGNLLEAGFCEQETFTTNSLSLFLRVCHFQLKFLAWTYIIFCQNTCEGQENKLQVHWNPVTTCPDTTLNLIQHWFFLAPKWFSHKITVGLRWKESTRKFSWRKQTWGASYNIYKYGCILTKIFSWQMTKQTRKVFRRLMLELTFAENKWVFRLTFTNA